MSTVPRGFPILRRGEDGYEDARLAAIWNGKKPDRFPDAVVVARDVEDVVAAVRVASEQDWTIGIRSGGHAWSANAVRDGGLLLDLSRLDDCEIDGAARTAAVGPGIRSRAFQKRVASTDSISLPEPVPRWVWADT